MSRLELLLLAVIVAAGCSPRELDLDPRWSPLERIVERPSLPGLPDHAATTIGPTVFVADLDDLIARTEPPDGIFFRALMAHEQLHSVRQHEAGISAWVARYATDKDFAWAEEQLGYWVQLFILRGAGLTVDIEKLAKSLSEYHNVRGAIVSEGEARTWLELVTTGRWAPDPGELGDLDPRGSGFGR